MTASRPAAAQRVVAALLRVLKETTMAIKAHLRAGGNGVDQEALA